jgi:hypothetical protein
VVDGGAVSLDDVVGFERLDALSNRAPEAPVPSATSPGGPLRASTWSAWRIALATLAIIGGPVDAVPDRGATSRVPGEGASAPGRPREVAPTRAGGVRDCRARRDAGDVDAEARSRDAAGVQCRMAVGDAASGEGARHTDGSVTGS